MTQEKLTIGKIALLSDVNVETVRYYQKIKLITEPVKPLEGYRLYSNDTVRQLKFIKKAQRLGFTLKEIAELLEIGSGKCSDIQSKALDKRDQITQQIKELQALESTLNDLINSCQETGSTNSCPIVKTLSELS